MGNGPCASRQTLFNILENCPTLKSVKLVGLDVSDPQSIDIWCAFLVEMYKKFDVNIDIFGYHDWEHEIPQDYFDKYLEENDSDDTFKKYLALQIIYLKCGRFWEVCQEDWLGHNWQVPKDEKWIIRLEESTT